MEQMINFLVDKVHVSESNLDVIRFVISRLKNKYKTFKALSKQGKRTLMKLAIKRHKMNKELYAYVMRGF